ncbi:CopG family antitoxin [Phormidium sp. FACHB-1136]|uniref:type II toxin-antitoxin system BrnA family antitoxin n=1 Tax=Phormidium sp. FACHB-1136 TaxID=2692848 RepID=UPI0016888966|nr:CopG family antitoxin [Phormidium sp. FACHB-1136]MBD2428410.1 CopG family transcriptional regulator [Phormidium sp. FACHB-1136]
MKAKDFDQKFDAGEDLTPYLDLAHAQRLGATHQRISIDLPLWLLERIDQEANQQGVSLQAIIQTSLVEHLALSKPQ